MCSSGSCAAQFGQNDSQRLGVGASFDAHSESIRFDQQTTRCLRRIRPIYGNIRFYGDRQHRRGGVAQLAFAVKLAPAKHLIGVDPVLTRDQRHRGTGPQRFFDNRALEFQPVMSIRPAPCRRSDRLRIRVHNPLCGHNLRGPSGHDLQLTTIDLTDGTDRTLTFHRKRLDNVSATAV